MESGKIVLGILGGVAVGALLGVLFAPHKGSKTRRKIVDTGKDYANDLKEKFDNLYKDVADKYEDVLTEAKGMVTSNNQS